MPRALITGITGQDGSYLSELLVAGGTEVHGLVLPGDPALDADADGGELLIARPHFELRRSPCGPWNLIS